MGKAVILINVKGLDGMIDAMKAVESPSFMVTNRLEESLKKVFATAQSRVHIISGNLHNSGDTQTDFNGKKWTGTMTWGGGTSTPPVNYAEIELNRGGVRSDGTPHDWLSGLEKFDQEFESALDSMFKALG